jgi:hypothetical protein
MNTALLIAALVSGLLALVFSVAGLRNIAVKARSRRLRGLLVALFFSLVTGVLTIVHLLSTTQGLGLR